MSDGGGQGDGLLAGPEADLKNASARWADREMVVDHGLVTSRDPGLLRQDDRRVRRGAALGRPIQSLLRDLDARGR